MERVKTTSLCLENLLMMQENERLRRKAQQLDQENKALLAQLKQQHVSASASQQATASASGAGASAAATENHRTHPKAKAAGKQQPK